MGIGGIIRHYLRQKEWRRRNQHNKTALKFGDCFPLDRAEVGRGTYGKISVLIYGPDVVLKIGNYCSIGPDVSFCLCAEHELNHISTYPFRAVITPGEQEACSRGDIIVEDDVWIGERTIILSGVRIGQGAVVGAGSVVTKDIPPYAVVAGNPAKVLRYRFSEELIGEILRIDFSKLELDHVKANMDLFYQELTPELLQQLPELPKRK